MYGNIGLSFCETAPLRLKISQHCLLNKFNFPHIAGSSMEPAETLLLRVLKAATTTTLPLTSLDLLRAETSTQAATTEEQRTGAEGRYKY